MRFKKWRCLWYQDANRRHGYVRKEHHEKKERDASRNDWREFKQVRRDKAKPGHPNSSMRNGIHQFFKKTSNRTERRSVNHQLHRGDWDNWLNLPPEYFCDPWGWD